MILLDASARRCEVLRRAVEEAGWEYRARVVHDRAERAGRDPGLRGSQVLVVARSFGAPAVLAECAAPLLHPDGLLVVSEPPSVPPDSGKEDLPVAHADRWPVAGLAQLGLAPDGFVRGVFGYQRLRQERLCPERFPRRDGVPAKKPLF